MALSPQEITQRVNYFRQRDAERNAAQEDVRAIRENRWQDVRYAAGLFPEDWPRGVASNMVNVVARDFAEMLGPLPTVDARSANNASDRAKAFADKRTKIVRYYTKCSNLQAQQFNGADRLMTYGYMAYIVEPDFKEKMPKIRIDDNFRAHYQLDRWGRRTLYYCKVFRRQLFDLMHEFPEAQAQLMDLMPYDRKDRPVEVVHWFDDDQEALVTLEKSVLLKSVPNVISRCPVRVVEMPKLGDCVQGMFDDAISIQLARSLMQTYALQAVDEIVNAPMVVPDDVQKVAFGPKEIIRTQQPQGVGKVPLQIPSGLFAEMQNLQIEQRIASRYPEGRSGNIDASIITGQGVEALMGTFSTVIRTGQMMLAQGLEDVISMALEMDEKLWPNDRKTVRGDDFGSPYEITYIPSRDIRGDYTCEVTYGLTAGLDPNRALVFILQALTAGIVSKDTAMRQLPVDINIEEEKRQIDIEMTRDALAQAIAGYAQAIPMLATQGMDPAGAVQQIAEVLRLRQKGKAIEEAVAEVFAPPPPPEPAATEEGGLASEAAPGEVFNEQTGLPEGIAPGQAQFGAGGARDLLMALAGTTPSGNPNLAMSVSRRVPA